MKKYSLILLSTILLISCGTRKSETNKTDVKNKDVVTDNSTIETKIDSNTKVIDCTSTDEVEIIPIDNTKEIIVNGKKYKNVRIKSKKTKNNVVVDKVVKVAKKQQNNIKKKSKANVQVKQKEVVSEKGNFWNWILLIILIIAFGYFFFWSRKIVRDKEKLNL
jgi:ATP-dependent Zn protease